MQFTKGGAMNYLRVKNWKTFQHFKERTPPWIKLYSNLLDDYVYNNLPIESQAIAPLIWLMASQQKESGVIQGDINLISYRLRRENTLMVRALTPLVEAGYFEVSDNFYNNMNNNDKTPFDINVISNQHQHDIPETYSKETYSKETETDISFENFWNIYGKIGNKQSALKAFKRIKGVDYEVIIGGVRKYQEYCRSINQERRFIKHASSWLNSRGWEDEYILSQAMARKPTADDNFTSGINEALLELNKR